MNNPTAPKTGETTVGFICNPESDLVSRSALLSFLARERSTVKNLQVVSGLFADHPTKSGRERWAITCGKLLVVDGLIFAVQTAPEVQKPHGEKTFSDHLLSREDELRLECERNNAAANDPLYLFPELARERADIAQGAAEEIARLRRLVASPSVDDGPVSLSGNAEEQPETREESPQPIGNPVTVAGTNPPRGLPAIDESSADFWAECATTAEIEALSEILLSELDSRLGETLWTAR